jgi:hypothetical protein
VGQFIEPLAPEQHSWNFKVATWAGGAAGFATDSMGQILVAELADLIDDASTKRCIESNSA